MRIRPILLLVAILAFVSVSFNASADGVTKRIKFAKGKSSATMSGAVVRGDRDTYILGANGGQTMSVDIDAAQNNAVFQITGPDGEFLPDAGQADDATAWSSPLPEDGEYKIIVGGTRGNASYKLTVAIK